MSPTFEATFWGFISGGALVLGAAVGYFARVPGSVVAGVMAFNSRPNYGVKICTKFKVAIFRSRMIGIIF